MTKQSQIYIYWIKDCISSIGRHSIVYCRLVAMPTEKRDQIIADGGTGDKSRLLFHGSSVGWHCKDSNCQHGSASSAMGNTLRWLYQLCMMWSPHPRSTCNTSLFWVMRDGRLCIVPSGPGPGLHGGQEDGQSGHDAHSYLNFLLRVLHIHSGHNNHQTHLLVVENCFSSSNDLY